MKISFSLVIVSLLLAIACGSAFLFRYVGTGSPQATKLKIRVMKAGGALNERKLTREQFETLELKEPTDLTTVYFHNERSGWVGGKEKVFKTEDGGKTWQAVKLEAPTGSHVQSIVFVEPLVGWIVLQTSSPLAINYKVHHFWLWHTNDGGQTWHLQYDGKEAELTSLSFVDMRNGWLGGIQYGGLRPFRYTYLLLRTRDQGKHWEDVSGGLKGVTATEKQVDADKINEGVMGLSLSKSPTVTLISSERELFSTSNDGQSWQRASMVQADSDQAGIRRFGSKADGKLWFLSSADSTEGVWSTLLVEQSDTSWTSFRLPGICFTDGVFLAGNQFLASGYVVDQKTGHSSETEGVVLHTPDEGRNWSIIYRGKPVKRISSLYIVDPTLALAVGENGLVLRLKIGSIAGND